MNRDIHVSPSQVAAILDFEITAGVVSVRGFAFCTCRFASANSRKKPLSCFLGFSSSLLYSLQFSFLAFTSFGLSTRFASSFASIFALARWTPLGLSYRNTGLKWCRSWWRNRWICWISSRQGKRSRSWGRSSWPWRLWHWSRWLKWRWGGSSRRWLKRYRIRCRHG